MVVQRWRPVFIALGAVVAIWVVALTCYSIAKNSKPTAEKARDLMMREGFPFTESRLVVVEASPSDLNRLMAALLEAELNVNYLYPFITQPHGKALLGMSVEDNEMAEQSLNRHQFRTLRQGEISR